MEKIPQSDLVAYEILNNLPVAIGIVDFERNIVFINNKFTEIFGYNRPDLKTFDDWKLSTYPEGISKNKTINIWSEHIRNAIEKKKKNHEKALGLNIAVVYTSVQFIYMG